MILYINIYSYLFIPKIRNFFLFHFNIENLITEKKNFFLNFFYQSKKGQSFGRNNSANHVFF